MMSKEHYDYSNAEEGSRGYGSIVVAWSGVGEYGGKLLRLIFSKPQSSSSHLLGLISISLHKSTPRTYSSLNPLPTISHLNSLPAVHEIIFRYRFEPAIELELHVVLRAGNRDHLRHFAYIDALCFPRGTKRVINIVSQMI